MRGMEQKLQRYAYKQLGQEALELDVGRDELEDCPKVLVEATSPQDGDKAGDNC